jgi:hypothetical protein
MDGLRKGTCSTTCQAMGNRKTLAGKFSTLHLHPFGGATGTMPQTDFFGVWALPSMAFRYVANSASRVSPQRPVSAIVVSCNCCA